MQIKSIFEEISTKVFTIRNLPEAKRYIIDFVKNKNILQKDKDAILRAVEESPSIYKLQNYICNSLLKYEGLSLSRKSA